jgi:hypothetical protein
MSDCPLVQLADNLKILKTFEQTGRVKIRLDDWIRFFEALTFINRDGGHREIHCAIVDEYLVFSKTSFKNKSK